jgi:uncharacterized membrane protein
MSQPPPPPGNYPPPPGGYPPPPPGQGGYPPPGPPGGYPPPGQGGYPPPPPPQGPPGYPPPPPPGHYQPPQQGGYPPPPQQGGYAPAPSGYGPPPGYGGAPAPFNVGEAFSWAWNKFSKNPGPLIIATLVFGLILGVLYGIIYGIAMALAPDTVSSYDSYDTGFSYSASAGFGAASLAVLIIGGLVLLVVAGAVQSAYIGGLLDIANGQPVTVGSFFKPRNVGSVVIAAVIVGILTAIGQALCVIPGLIVGIFTIFTTVAIVDRNLKPIDGIKTSFELAKANFVPTLLTWLLVAVILAVGAILCGVGLLVAAPVALLFLVYSWRKLSGGQVAPLTP